MAMTAAAGDRDWDRRDLRNDYGRVERLRMEVARERARLNEDLRCGRRWAVENDRRELMRDERELSMLERDAAYDRRDLRRDDYRYNNGGNYNSYGNGNSYGYGNNGGNYNNGYNNNGYGNGYTRR